MKPHLYLCGAGNPEGIRLAVQINARRSLWSEIILLDDNPAQHGREHIGVVVAGSFAELADADSAASQVVNLISRTTRRRRDARARIEAFGIPWAPLISEDVELLGASTGSDLIAYKHSTIGAEADVGEGAVVFTGAIVGHGCRLGDHCIVAPNAVINARVRVGEGAYIGSNAVVLPDIEIGSEAVIGAGAVIVDHIPSGATVLGPTGDVLLPDADGARKATVDIPATLGRIWCEVLGVEQLVPTHRFFDAGGTSLMAMQIAQRVEAATGLHVCALDIFRYPTLAEFGQHLVAGPEALPSQAIEEARRRAEQRRDSRARNNFHSRVESVPRQV